MTQRGHRIFASVYDAMNRHNERGWLGERRARLLAGLEGVVLDVGAGTGANLPHFRAAGRVIAVEPDPAMRSRLTARLGQATVPVEVADAAAESLPYPDGSIDAVVFTLVLCTVADPDVALAEAHRVLKPDGRLVVIEHVRGTGRLARWQDRITPVWKRLAAGCHPGRDTRAAIERAGFDLARVEEFRPIPAWMPVSPWLEAEVVSRS